MKNETPAKVWRRCVAFGVLLLGVIWILDRTAYRARIQEEKSALVFTVLDSNKVITDELMTLLNQVQNDLFFFEKEIKYLLTLPEGSDAKRATIDSLTRFLSTHADYSMVRMTNESDNEIFKIQQDEQNQFVLSRDLINLGAQPFYQELNSVEKDQFYFSRMEPLIISGKVVQPLRPTIRISKRVEFDKNRSGLLIFNVDGRKILRLLAQQRSQAPMIKKGLIDERAHPISVYDHDGFESLDQNITHKLRKSIPSLGLQGSIDFKEEMIVYSKIQLPLTRGSWFLVNRIPKSFWEVPIRKMRLTWIFWALVCFVLLLFIFWRNEKKRYKDEVVEVLLRERNEFIQNVSHQLKTPLAILFNSISSLDANADEIAELKKELRHLIKIVDDMLLLALVEANPQIPLSQQNIIDIISNAIMVVGPKAKEKSILIKLNIDEKLLKDTDQLERPVMADLFQSAIMNLLDNALKYSPANDTIEVFLSKPGQQLMIQVKDNGPGITDDLAAQLFNRFVKGSTGQQGTGLGLSIAKKIIELHEGEIRHVPSERGTVFQVII